MSKLKKSDISEIIDGDDNIIGKNATPEISPDMETRASKTTDANIKSHGQNYKNDFLGRFGFYFYESEGQDKPAVVEALENIVGDKANVVMETIKPFIEEAIDGTNFNINESNVVEDKISDKKVDNSLSTSTKDKELSSKKIEDVAELLNKLPKVEINKLINLLESDSVSKPDALKEKMKEVSLGKDDDGYYVYTHRASSKRYDSPEQIPDKDIKFITSTG